MVDQRYIGGFKGIIAMDAFQDDERLLQVRGSTFGCFHAVWSKLDC